MGSWAWWFMSLSPASRIAEAGGLQLVQGYCGLCSQFQAGQGYTEKLHLRQNEIHGRLGELAHACNPGAQEADTESSAALDCRIMEHRRQLRRADFLLPPCGSQGLASGGQAWHKPQALSFGF